jgi:signal transduction histidine kinase
MSTRERPSPEVVGDPVTGSVDDGADVLVASRDRTQALRAIRDDLGFDTASLFVPTPTGWDLLEREGPVRRWHAVLDPGALEGTPEVAEYPDTRSIPGVGLRLARMGCASAASLPLPEGARVILDSAEPNRLGGWIERAGPYIELIGLLHGPMWSGAGALRDQAETPVLSAAFAACRMAVTRPGAGVEDLLEECRSAIGASELFLLSDRGAEIEVHGPEQHHGPRRLSRQVVPAGPDGSPALDGDGLGDLAMALGMTSRVVAGGAAEGGHVVIAGWSDRPALSSVSMSVIANAASTSAAALRSRQQAVSTVIERERTRMAYALHDGLTQTVAGAVLELEALHRRVEDDPDAALRSLERSKVEIRRALAELRSMLFDLSERAQDPGPSEPLRSYVDEVLERWHLPARVVVEGDFSRVPARVMSVAYVVVREALANAAKHAGDSPVRVRVAATDGDLAVTVGDDGQGFSPRDEQAARAAHHIGLEMLRRRVRDVGGRLRIESRSGAGTRVTAHFPIEGDR